MRSVTNSEVVHHEEIPGHPKQKQSKSDIKAKSIPVTPKTVAVSTGSVRERWFESIYKEIANFLLNMAITDADPALVIKFKSIWEMATTMSNGLCTQKPLTQVQQTEVDLDEAYKHKKLCSMGRTLDDYCQL